MTSEQYRSVRGRMLTALAIVLGILASGVVVLTASRAAFSDTADNQSNYFVAGNVELTDELNNATVLFEVDDMVPGQVETRCIEVTYSGSVANPGPVRFYSGGATDTGLGAHLNLTVEEGIGGTFADCSGFDDEVVIESGTFAAFAATHTNYGNGAGTWDPASTPESRTYRITVEFDADAPNDAQGESVTDLTFTWEVQS
jgi:hypothetical protein